MVRDKGVHWSTCRIQTRGGPTYLSMSQRDSGPSLFLMWKPDWRVPCQEVDGNSRSEKQGERHSTEDLVVFVHPHRDSQENLFDKREGDQTDGNERKTPWSKSLTGVVKSWYTTLLLNVLRKHLRWGTTGRNISDPPTFGRDYSLARKAFVPTVTISVLFPEGQKRLGLFTLDNLSFRVTHICVSQVFRLFFVTEPSNDYSAYPFTDPSYSTLSTRNPFPN